MIQCKLIDPDYIVGAYTWCIDQFGIEACELISSNAQANSWVYDGNYYSFASDSDAMLFILRWPSESTNVEVING